MFDYTSIKATKEKSAKRTSFSSIGDIVHMFPVDEIFMIFPGHIPLQLKPKHQYWHQQKASVFTKESEDPFVLLENLDLLLPVPERVVCKSDEGK